jgi:tetratricopeptide (TPR) repeat protein
MPEDEPKPRRASLTPEQRRFLNQPKISPPSQTEVKAGATDAKSLPPEPREEPKTEPQKPPTSPKVSARPAPPGAAPVTLREEPKGSRIVEIQQAALILGAVLLLALTFFLGKNFDRLKYMVLARTKPPLEKIPDNYPGVSAPDLVDQALQKEKEGDWKEAVKMFLTAKQKDLRYRGLFLRVGKLFFTHHDYASADKAFDRAILFDEDLGEAWQYRGFVAIQRNDFTAAQHHFEEATRADPLVADYYYFWAEAYRLGLQPKAAIPPYEEALARARNEQDATVCAFKIRLARMEAAESPQIETALTEKAAAGPLPVDWLLTAAALKLREGQIDEVIRYVDQARMAKDPGLLSSCLSDMVFKDAVRKHPELAIPLHLDVPQNATIR